MDVTTDFRGNGYSKNRLICDCAGEPTDLITTLLSNSLLVPPVAEGSPLLFCCVVVCLLVLTRFDVLPDVICVDLLWVCFLLQVC